MIPDDIGADWTVAMKAPASIEGYKRPPLHPVELADDEYIVLPIPELELHDDQ